MFSSTTYTADETQVKAVRQPQKRIARIELESGVNFTVTESSLPLQIGRERDCDITIPNGHVSRHHCELFMANGVLCLKDTSSNGTLVGSQNIKDDSVTIQQRTAIVVAGDARLVITPLDEAETVKSRLKNLDRREDERRDAERRQESIVVPFEQRKQLRREGERRRDLHR